MFEFGITLLLITISLCISALTYAYVFERLTELSFKTKMKKYSQSVAYDDSHQEEIEEEYESQEIDEYNLHISKLKEELAYANIAQASPTDAVSFHPGVYNIPHESVEEMIKRTSKNEEEYSE